MIPMATDRTREATDRLTPEQRARVEALRAKARTPAARRAEAAERAEVARELAEGGAVATTGDKAPMEDVVAFRRFIMDLRRRREALGMSLGDVARATGIDKSALSRLESGEQMNPTVHTLMRYVRAIGGPIRWHAGAAEIGAEDAATRSAAHAPGGV
jgi:ribosome-binding protein aMBF1 (putative translation factor)